MFSKMSASTFNFATGFRGYHVRGEISKPSLNQTINFKQERNNRHDRFAMPAESFYLVCN